jgi:peptide/nickel transport system permease protein
VAIYTVKRLVAAVPTLIPTSMIVFGLMRLLPGDVLGAMLADASVSAEERERMRADLGLDRSYPVQYVT